MPCCLILLKKTIRIFQAISTYNMNSKPAKCSTFCSVSKGTSPAREGASKCKLSSSSNQMSTSETQFEILETPIKSSSDKKQYRVIRLANGLTACLVSSGSPSAQVDDEDESESGSTDDETSGSSEAEGEDGTESEDEEASQRNEARSSEQKMAAAALTVGVGSFSDPKEVPGMAHFLEHMVFMGSEKFPEENDFDAFIKNSGGQDNASTSTETTCFYFDCLEKHLHAAVDKFAQFFISPLMKKTSMAREREAIESEFQMNLPSDYARKEQLMCSFAKANSPVNSFFWGNLVTLRDNISDDDLYKGLHEFRKRHYSAHRMTLAVQARLPLDTLQDLVVESFSKVPNNQFPPLDFSPFAETVFNTRQFKRLYFVKPSRDLTMLYLTWAVPSLRQKYRIKPQDYLAFLLGYEGKGSLLSYLKQKIWVLGISSGDQESGVDENELYSLFSLSLLVTEEGIKHIFEMVEVIFSYINMLKRVGPQKRIFDELQQIADMSFQHATEETAVETVETLSESMHIYPPQDYLTGPELYSEYDPKAIEQLTNLLRPDNMNLMFISKILPDGRKWNKVEPWFGTRYTDEEIPKEWIKRWQRAKPLPELTLPEENPFITHDFTILPKTKEYGDYPQKILATRLYELWYRQDQKFLLPIAYYNFSLVSPFAINSPLCTGLLDILVNLLAIGISEEAYPAVCADLSYVITANEKGLVIKVSGFNEKLPVLIQLIAQFIKNFPKTVTKEMFEAVKDKVLKTYNNKLMKPATLAKELRLHLIVKECWTSVDVYSALSDVTFETMLQFNQDIFKTVFVQCLIQGNVTEDVALEVVDKLTTTLEIQELPPDSYPKFPVVELPLGERCCRVLSFNTHDSNSIVSNYYQVGTTSVKSSVILELIMLIIEEPLFDTLRTKEQLGYDVHCSMRDTFGILGYTITVNAQATKTTTQYVDERVEAFVKYAGKMLNELDEDHFQKVKDSLIKMKQIADIHLKEEVDRNWVEITSDYFMFDRLSLEIDEVSDVQLEDIREWWEQHNKFGDQTNFRKISIQVVGYNIKQKHKRSTISTLDAKLADQKLSLVFSDVLRQSDGKKEEQPADYFITNPKEFKANLNLYPSIRK